MTFITIEGLDGAGKDTALDAIRACYPDATFTSEPSDLDTGKLVRRCLSDEETPPLMDFYLFMADRVNHIEQRVRPVDESGGLVVSGRYADSTRAYQPVALEEAGVFNGQWAAKDFIEKTMHPWNYAPDATLYLDISVDTAIERASGDEKYEQRDFLEKVRANYEGIANSNAHGDRIIRIDAEQPKEEVRGDVKEAVAAVVDPAGSVKGW
jgi:dTMP kinase